MPLPALIAAGGAIGAGLISAYAASKQNDKNVDYQERENELARQREDTAYSRAVADARNAGLSPLVVSGTSGFSAQSMTAPQLTQNPVHRGIETFNQARATQSQIDFNNALSSKAVEEARGQSIHNSNMQAEYTAKLLKLYDESKKIRVETSREQEFLRKYRERLEQELRGLTLGNESKAVSNLISEGSRQYNESLGLNPSTSWTSSASSPIGYGMAVGKTLSEQSATEKNNALADKANKEALYKEYLEDYQKLYSGLLSDWQHKYNVAEKSFKGKPHGYIELQNWLKNNPKPKYYAPKKSDFGL